MFYNNNKKLIEKIIFEIKSFFKAISVLFAICNFAAYGQSWPTFEPLVSAVLDIDVGKTQNVMMYHPESLLSLGLKADLLGIAGLNVHAAVGLSLADLLALKAAVTLCIGVDGLVNIKIFAGTPQEMWLTAHDCCDDLTWKPPCTTSNNQGWVFVPNGTNQYSIVHALSGKAIAFVGGPSLLFALAKINVLDLAQVFALVNVL